ncbi:MAG: MBL fold metallo-hydrolase, partial [Clostridia bacterium]|nr:MBL fold metallo-hydrolase [Clostridia bacterium]
MAAKKSSSKKAQKQAVKYAKQHKKAVAIFVCVVLIIIIAAVLLIYLFKPEIFDRALKEYNDYVSQLYNDSADDDAENVSAKLPNEIQSGDLDSISTSEFSIHFLELGNKYAGDCTLIKCGNTEVLIDAGSRTNSATTISAYVDRYCTDGKLEYVIATHAHQDHIAGFVGKGSGDSKTGILYKYEVGTVIQ